MENFWKWMEKKKYGMADLQTIIGLHGDEEPFTKQMIIGYLIEYLSFKLKYEDLLIELRTVTTDKLYDRLIEKIEAV